MCSALAPYLRRPLAFIAARTRSPPCRRCGYHTGSRPADRANRERRSWRRTAGRSRQDRARPGDCTPCTTRISRTRAAAALPSVMGGPGRDFFRRSGLGASSLLGCRLRWSIFASVAGTFAPSRDRAVAGRKVISAHALRVRHTASGSVAAIRAGVPDPISSFGAPGQARRREPCCVGPPRRRTRLLDPHCVARRGGHAVVHAVGCTSPGYGAAPGMVR